MASRESDAALRLRPADAKAVNAQFDRLLDYVDGKLADAHDHLDTARADILVFTGFPEGL